jgi:hypothetical protein
MALAIITSDGAEYTLSDDITPEVFTAKLRGTWIDVDGARLRASAIISVRKRQKARTRVSVPKAQIPPTGYIQ